MEQDSIPLLQDGINTKLFEISIKESKLCYLIPDFHNPTSITYSKDNRKRSFSTNKRESSPNNRRCSVQLSLFQRSI